MYLVHVYFMALSLIIVFSFVGNSYLDILHSNKRPFYNKGREEDSSAMDAYLMHSVRAYSYSFFLRSFYWGFLLLFNPRHISPSFIEVILSLCSWITFLKREILWRRMRVKLQSIERRLNKKFFLMMDFLTKDLLVQRWPLLVSFCSCFVCKYVCCSYLTVGLTILVYPGFDSTTDEEYCLSRCQETHTTNSRGSKGT